MGTFLFPNSINIKMNKYPDIPVTPAVCNQRLVDTTAYA